MNSLYDDNGMLIVRDPSVWSWKSPSRRKLEAWSKMDGKRRICKSCGVNAAGKPSELCSSPRHHSYYEDSLRRHRKRNLIEVTGNE